MEIIIMHPILATTFLLFLAIADPKKLTAEIQPQYLI